MTTSSYESLSHSKWDGKYHVVFIPKGRKKALYGKIRSFLGPVLRELAGQRGSTILEGHRQGHSGVVQRLHSRLQEEIKGCVPGEALLARHPSHGLQPSPKVEPHDSISPSAHRSIRCDT